MARGSFGRWDFVARDLDASVMVLRADVLDAAITDARSSVKGVMPLIYLSPRGRPMDQALMRDLSKADGVTLLCGRFEGVDERILDHYNIIEVSLGDFVMTGGELAAQALIDAKGYFLDPKVLEDAFINAFKASTKQGDPISVCG